MNKRERAQEQWEQLKWEEWLLESKRARWSFGDHTLSIICGDMFYSDGKTEYEVAVVDEYSGVIYGGDLAVLGLPYTEDVYTYLSKDEVIDLAVILLGD